MLFRKRTFPRWLFLIPIAILLAIGIATAVSRSRPQVANTFPAASDVAVAQQAPLRITFSQNMSQGSLPANLQTNPPREGSFTWEGQTLIYRPNEPWPPGESIQVTIQTGARNAFGLGLRQPETWSFKVAPTMLAYLWPADGPADIYALDPSSGDTIRLTNTPFGVQDFSVAPDGLQLLYSEKNSSNGTDLKRFDWVERQSANLITCGHDQCVSLQASPQGDYLAYENASFSQIWLIPAGQSPILIGEGTFPTWSATNQLLAYDRTAAAYFTFDPESGEILRFENLTGEPAAWNPDGRSFTAPDIFTDASTPASHLLRYETRSRLTEDLSKNPGVEDTGPAFAPDGSLLAFSRRFLDLERWSPGRQIWLTSPNGLNPAPLTNAPIYNHTGLAWHPDSRQLAFVRSNQADLNEPPEIWLIEINSTTPIRMVIGGFAPAWIP
jgi:Tol biopolymer transport system component